MHFASRLAPLRAPFVLALALGIAVANPAFATQVAGGGNPAADCYSTFDVLGTTVSGTTADCKAGDPNCNSNLTTCDATATSCTFRVRQCIRQQIAGCTVPNNITKVKITPPLGTPVIGNTSTCGDFVDVTVPLKKHGTKSGKKKFTLKATSDGKPKIDKDTLILKCDLPATSGCQNVVCGDGIVSPKEECDPAAANPGCTGGKVCNNSCACVVDNSVCGDGAVTGLEACDDNATPTGCGAGQVCAACHCETACPQVAGNVPTKLKFTQLAGTTACGPAGLKRHCATHSADPTDPVDGADCTSDADCSGLAGACILLQKCNNPNDVNDPNNGIICTSDADCGLTGATCVPPIQFAAPPFGGEVQDANNTKINDLSLSCLYLGNGGNIATSPSNNPDGSIMYLTPTCPAGADLTNITLKANSGTTLTKDCSFGPSASKKKCQNGSAGTGGGACTTDADCGGSAGGGQCQPDTNCFFGPPLPIPNGAVSTCVLNQIKADVSGTLNATTGDITTTIPLTSLVYLTSNGTEPCPVCNAGTCSAGPNQGLPCTPVGSKGTTQDCPPTGNQFVGPIPVTLAGITTGQQTKQDPDGFFCQAEGQTLGNAEPGAFGHTRVRKIISQGSPGGDMSGGASQTVVVAGAFCIPASGSGVIDAAASLPGPGQTSLKYDAQLLP